VYKSNQAGIAHLVAILGVVLICAIGGVTYYVVSKNSNNNESNHNVASQQATSQTSTQSKSTSLSQAAFAAELKKVSDPDKQQVASLLAADCGTNAGMQVINNLNDPQRFLIKGYFARARVDCDGGGFTAYLTKDDEGNWKIIEKTQQAPNCENFDNEVGLSRDIVKTCYDEKTLQERDVQ
jgi:hypothetical protein